MRVIYHATGTLLSLCLCFVVMFSPLNLHAQSQSLNLQQKTASSSAPPEIGTPERGRFRLVYSYSGEPVDATVTITKNGAVVGRQNGLEPVTDAVLADLTVARGDVLAISSSFRGSTDSGIISDLPFGHPAGFWYSFGSGAFYALGPEGNIIEVFGTWNFTFTLDPPWNAIDLQADPSSISQGEASTITLQTIEAPGTPVIVPDVTAINLQPGPLGRLIGGISLRYTDGFAGAPYATVTNTPILYEAFPDSLFPFLSEDATIGLAAFSPITPTLMERRQLK